MPNHRVSLQYQKMAVSRAIDILNEIYPARIAQKKSSIGKAETHIDYLTEALITLDGLEKRRDMREDLDPWKGKANDDQDHPHRPR